MIILMCLSIFMQFLFTIHMMISIDVNLLDFNGQEQEIARESNVMALEKKEANFFQFLFVFYYRVLLLFRNHMSAIELYY